MPPALTMGNGLSSTSSGVSRGVEMVPSAMACQSPCARGTPFGRPSVPDVQHRVTQSLGCNGMSGAPSSLDISRARSITPAGRSSPQASTVSATPVAWAANRDLFARPTVTNTFSPASFPSWVSSCRAYWIGNAQAIAPRLATARYDTASSAMFGSCTPTTSPCRTPARYKDPAS